MDVDAQLYTQPRLPLWKATPPPLVTIGGGRVINWSGCFLSRLLWLLNTQLCCHSSLLVKLLELVTLKEMEKQVSVWILVGLTLLVQLQQGPGQHSRYRDSLRTGRSVYRIPVGARFSASLQTGPGAHPVSYTVGTGSFPGVKQSGRGIDHPPPSSAKVEGRVELYICFSSGPLWPVIGRTLP